MDGQASGWSFPTNHARVLLAIARDPAARLRDLAAACHITERTVQDIVGDLEEGGYLSRERHGRRTRYTLRLGGTLRHPAEAHLPVSGLLELNTFPDGSREGAAHSGSPSSSSSRPGAAGSRSGRRVPPAGTVARKV
ncbi:MarR family transcriptional regulator [Streptomyces hygroscopicus]|uniref:MarR family transcriptional regulator n=1 Tax=Streptomyces hygroscopicus TaxID=1912 RepID=UPI00362B2A49